MEDQEYLTITEEIQRLRDEQQRLRDEQEKLRRERSASTNGNHADGAHNQQEDQKENQDSSQDKQSGGKNSNTPKAEKKDGNGGKDGNENKPKTPIIQKVKAYSQSHPKTIFYGGIGFIAACILVFFLILYLGSYENTDDAQVDGHLNAVSSRVNGTVLKVYVDDNQSVAAGQLLAELDPRDFQTALDQAKAAYYTAQAQLIQENPNVAITRTSNKTAITTGGSEVDSAQSGVLAAEEQYQAKLAELRQAEANNVKAQTDVLRYRPLVMKAEISKEQFDTVVAQAKTQEASVEAAKSSARAAQKQIEQRREQLQQAHTRLLQAHEDAPRNLTIRKASVQAKEAAVQSAKAQVEQAELNLSYTKIYAPVAGIVGQKELEIGQRVETGQQLLSVTQTGDIWVTANFKETQLRKMRPGQPVDISVDAFGKKYRGYVESMPGATGSITSLLPPENATGNYVKVVQRLPVRIRLKDGEDPGHTLRPGMSVEPKVWLK